MATTRLLPEEIKIIGGYKATVGRKRKIAKINPLAPSIEDKITCEEVGGKWNDDYEVCIFAEGPDGGWTAPVKGAYVWYSVVDLYEAIGDEDLKGKYTADVMACLVVDSGLYPTFAGGCTPILELDVNEYYLYEDPDEAKEDAKKLMLQVAKDIKEGDAEYWGLEYCNPRGRKTSPDDPNAIASDSCKFVANLMKNVRGIKSLEEFID